MFKCFFEKVQLEIIDKSILPTSGFLYDLLTNIWWKLFKIIPFS